MDISEQYIKMCETAPRELTKPISILSAVTLESNQEYRAQILYCTLHKRFIGHDYTNCLVCGEWDICEEHWIRLPRQDDLQAMLSNIGLQTLTHKFSFWNTNRPELWTDSDIFKSMEQLWFAFVMGEKYNKIWNGEDWAVLTTSTGG